MPCAAEPRLPLLELEKQASQSAHLDGLGVQLVLPLLLVAAPGSRDARDLAVPDLSVDDPLPAPEENDADLGPLVLERKVPVPGRGQLVVRHFPFHAEEPERPFEAALVARGQLGNTYDCPRGIFRAGGGDGRKEGAERHLAHSDRPGESNSVSVTACTPSASRSGTRSSIVRRDSFLPWQMRT